MSKLYNQIGRHKVGRALYMYVPPKKKPFFDIRVTHTRYGLEKTLRVRIHVDTASDYEPQLANAVARQLQMTAEIRRVIEKQHRELEAQRAAENDGTQARNAACHAARCAARDDVRRVLAQYGPSIDIIKPFFIQQWV